MLLEIQNDILKRLAQGDEPSVALNALCIWLENKFPSTIATVMLVDDSGRLWPFVAPTLEPSFTSVIAGLRIGPLQGSCGAAAYGRKAVTDIDLVHSPRWRQFLDFVGPLGLAACFSSPILSREGRVIGTVALYFREHRGPTPFEQSIVEGCLSLCMIALEHRERLSEMERLAFTDALTGLPNRTAFNRCMASKDDAPSSILLVDVDNLKQVNDTFGHVFGDYLIKVVAERLSALVPTGQAFRIGGDEFALLLGRHATIETSLLAEQIRTTFGQPCVFRGVKIRPSVTMGLSSDDGSSLALDLLHQADQALYHGKEQARGTWTKFDARVATTMNKRNLAIQLVSAALADGRVEAWYQPICRLDTHEFVGVEALARVRSPNGNIIAAQDFHEATKDAQVAAELTRQMIRCVTRDVSAWIAAGVFFQHVGINISANDLGDDNFPQHLSEAFNAASIPLKHVILEVTESVYLGDHNGKTANRIRELRDVGFRIALDDFGTGFASLTHLLTVPVDVIKIDKSFVDLLGINCAGTAIIEGLLHITKRMGIKVVAEGIEEARQEDLLLRRGCVLGQGYLYARPVTSAAALEMLKERGQSPARQAS